MAESANMAAVSVRLNPIGVLLVCASVACVFAYLLDVPKWFKSEQKINMKELLSVSIDLAQRGGRRVKEVRLSTRPMHQEVKGKTMEGADELKTDGDMKSHQAMVYGFAKAFQGLKVISEEHEVKPVDISAIATPNKKNREVEALDGEQNIPISDITVWIDPLDATQEYSENLQDYVTTMVCVAVRGQPKIGVVHSPFSQETVWGWVGYGHSKNIAPADQHSRKDTDVYKIIVSRSHSGSVKSVAETAFEKNVKVIPAGGAGYKTLAVIKGDADAYVHVTHIKKWDICAGNAIIMAVNGRMTTLSGFNIDYTYSDSVVNNKGLLATIHDHDLFLKKLKPAFDDLTKHEEEKKKQKQHLST